MAAAHLPDHAVRYLPQQILRACDGFDTLHADELPVRGGFGADFVQ
jgi:hypothetical protein